MSNLVDFDKVLETLETIAFASDMLIKQQVADSDPLLKQVTDGFYSGYRLGCKNSRTILMQQYERGKLS